MKKYDVEIIENIAIVSGEMYEIRSLEDFRAEVSDGENECAYTFTSRPYTSHDDRKFMLWGDNETDEHFITFM